VSFRNRLGLFFVLIVIVPMIAVAVLLFGLLGQSGNLAGDANVDARQKVARTLFADEQRAADRLLTTVGTDDVFSSSLQAGQTARAEKRARQLLKSRDIERIVLVKRGDVVFAVGDRTAVAPMVRRVETQGTKVLLGELGVSRIDAREFAGRVRRVTGLEVVIRNGSRLLTSTFPKGTAPPSRAPGEEVEVAGRSYGVDAIGGGFPGQKIRILSFATPEVAATGGIDRLAVGGILLGFLLLALICAVLVSRSLQQQLAGFLDAARRLASGDFSAHVTTVGKDEFAGLGDEFNKMARELERRLAELQQERERVQDAMRRLGDAVAVKLDRDALLDLVVRSAIDGVAADAGRAHVRGADELTLQQRVSHGNMNGLESAVQSVESEALRLGSPQESAGEHANAMAHPLRAASGGEAIGVISVGRTGKAFTVNERELFHHLAGQGARAMEDVDRHETVSRESITDELTGLENLRAFRAALNLELSRFGRDGSPVGLVLLDLDNFKSINDTYGHPQGDVVLREVARVLRESSRDIDHPARHGGEEFAFVLPATDLEGAYNFAERVRVRIEQLHIPRLDGVGTLRITTSCGVNSVPHNPPNYDALIAAADAALYEAKSSGKNKTVRAR